MDEIPLFRSYQYMKYILDYFYEENGDFQLGGYYYSEMKERFSDLFSGIINAKQKIKRIVEYLISTDLPLIEVNFQRFEKTHKGDLTFISGSNKGTRAIISLPIKSDIYSHERKFNYENNNISLSTGFCH